jgi:hypothetical protein
MDLISIILEFESASQRIAGSGCASKLKPDPDPHQSERPGAVEAHN